MAATPPHAEGMDFVVDRSDLRRVDFVAAPPPAAPEPGHVLLRVDAFAFTANNVTYAVAGDMLSYWSFFPARAGWGRVPVWGFADVIGSRHSNVPEGTRVFGYLPMSTHLVVQPERVNRMHFVDGAPHRAGLPPIYNQYSLVAADPGYARADEDQQMLFRPLFMTAFLLDDFLADNGFFGARAVILSSASSKTALSLAFLLSKTRRGACEVIGLTSPGNRAFVEGLGCYDRICTYDQLGALPRQPVAFVDMAGDGQVIRTLHHHFRDDMKHSCIVGLTHWEQRAPAEELPGAPPTFFFAPTQLQKRTEEWGAQGFQQRLGSAWRQFLEFIKAPIQVLHGRGPGAVERVYKETLEGRAKPNQGHVLSLWQ